MANIASLLKEEITRLARKELRSETESLKKMSSRYRSDIAALKRQVTALEQQAARLEKLLAKATPAAPPRANGEDAATSVRFSAKGLKKHRERLGLSAALAGKVLGVSSQTVYNWESGSTRPAREQLLRIADFRRMGKRDAQALSDAAPAA